MALRSNPGTPLKTSKVLQPKSHLIAGSQYRLEQRFHDLGRNTTDEVLSPSLWLLKQVAREFPELQANYARSAGVCQGYTNGEHVQMVADIFLGGLSCKEYMRRMAMATLLTVHDGVKSEANYETHSEECADWLIRNAKHLPLTPDETKIGAVLFCSNAVTKLLQSCQVERGFSPKLRKAFIVENRFSFDQQCSEEFFKMTPTYLPVGECEAALQIAIAQIKSDAVDASISPKAMLHLARVFTCADIGAYTEGLSYCAWREGYDPFSDASCQTRTSIPGLDWVFRNTPLSGGYKAGSSPLRYNSRDGVLFLSTGAEALVQELVRRIDAQS